MGRVPQIAQPRKRKLETNDSAVASAKRSTLRSHKGNSLLLDLKLEFKSAPSKELYDILINEHKQDKLDLVKDVEDYLEAQNKRSGLPASLESTCILAQQLYSEAASKEEEDDEEEDDDEEWCTHAKLYKLLSQVGGFDSPESTWNLSFERNLISYLYKNDEDFVNGPHHLRDPICDILERIKDRILQEMDLAFPGWKEYLLTIGESFQSIKKDEDKLKPQYVDARTRLIEALEAMSKLNEYEKLQDGKVIDLSKEMEDYYVIAREWYDDEERQDFFQRHSLSVKDGVDVFFTGYGIPTAFVDL